MLIVFDLDGTVIDSTQALLTAQEAAWASVGLLAHPLKPFSTSLVYP